MLNKICILGILIVLNLLSVNVLKAQKPRNSLNDRNLDGVVMAFDVNKGDKGFLLPEVELVSLTKYSPVKGTPIRGMLIFNTALDESKNLFPGIYSWDSNSWARYLQVSDIPTITKDVERVYMGNRHPDYEIITIKNAPKGSIYINYKDKKIYEKDDQWQLKLDMSDIYVAGHGIKLEQSNGEKVLSVVSGNGINVDDQGVSVDAKEIWSLVGNPDNALTDAIIGFNSTSSKTNLTFRTQGKDRMLINSDGKILLSSLAVPDSNNKLSQYNSLLINPTTKEIVMGNSLKEVDPDNITTTTTIKDAITYFKSISIDIDKEFEDNPSSSISYSRAGVRLIPNTSGKIQVYYGITDDMPSADTSNMLSNFKALELGYVYTKGNSPKLLYALDITDNNKDIMWYKNDSWDGYRTSWASINEINGSTKNSVEMTFFIRSISSGYVAFIPNIKRIGKTGIMRYKTIVNAYPDL